MTLRSCRRKESSQERQGISLWVFHPLASRPSLILDLWQLLLLVENMVVLVVKIWTVSAINLENSTNHTTHMQNHIQCHLKQSLKEASTPKRGMTRNNRKRNIRKRRRSMILQTQMILILTLDQRVRTQIVQVMIRKRKRSQTKRRKLKDWEKFLKEIGL